MLPSLEEFNLSRWCTYLHVAKRLVKISQQCCHPWRINFHSSNHILAELRNSMWKAYITQSVSISRHFFTSIKWKPPVSMEPMWTWYPLFFFPSHVTLSFTLKVNNSFSKLAFPNKSCRMSISWQYKTPN